MLTQCAQCLEVSVKDKAGNVLGPFQMSRNDWVSLLKEEIAKASGQELNTIGRLVYKVNANTSHDLQTGSYNNNRLSDYIQQEVKEVTLELV